MKKLTTKSLLKTLDKMLTFEMMTKLDKVVNIYSYDDDKFRIDDWNDIIMELLKKYYGYNLVNRPYIKTNGNISGILLLKESYIGVIKSDITKIDFNTLYPNIIVKLFDRGDLEFNIHEFGYIFKGLLEARREVKDLSDPTNHNTYKHLKMFINVLINFTYGCIRNYNERSIISASNTNNIPTYCSDIFNHIFNENNTVMYIDTDEIYIDGRSELDGIIAQIDKLDLPYRVTYNNIGMFIGKKRFGMTDSNGVDISRGIKRMAHKK
jgi:hypothetical protein